MYANLKSISDLFRSTLPAITATVLLSGPVVAQHYDFDTRYRPNNSMTPWHSQQAFPSGFHQLETPTIAAQPIVEAVPSQPIIQPMMIETQHDQALPTPIAGEVLAFPTHAAVPAVETPLLETPMMGTPMIETPTIETPMIETPMVGAPMTETPIAGAESELPTQWNQEIPEGYDPAYPIEYPGSNFQGYYPVEGGIVAPPTGEIVGETSPSQPVSDSFADTGMSSSDSEAPMIPSVVVADSETGIVMPEPGMINESPDMTNSEETMPQSDELSANNLAVTAADRNGDAESEADLIRKLKQRLQAADLRAREAEEKAMAIARQASEDQRQLDQLKAQTAESNSSAAKAKSQENTLQKKIDQLKTELDSSNEAVKRMRALVTKNQKKMKQLREKLNQSNASKKQLEAQNAEATPQLDLSPNEAAGGIEANNVTEQNAAKDNPNKTKSNKTKSNKSAKESNLTKKISNLETARDKQLASAAARIKSDFQAKIDAKLDSGKTADHPEVKALKDSLQQRLKESDKNIRRRYQRQINKLLKEAAARSRS